MSQVPVRLPSFAAVSRKSHRFERPNACRIAGCRRGHAQVTRSCSCSRQMCVATSTGVRHQQSRRLGHARGVAGVALPHPGVSREAGARAWSPPTCRRATCWRAATCAVRSTSAERPRRPDHGRPGPGGDLRQRDHLPRAAAVAVQPALQPDVRRPGRRMPNGPAPSVDAGGMKALKTQFAPKRHPAEGAAKK